MIVLTFKPRFRPKVLDRTKTNTMRADRKRPVKVGDLLSLRGWSGRPYMTPQIKLMEVVCTLVCPVLITREHAEVDGQQLLAYDDLCRFAVRDGFADWPDLVAYFHDNGGLPFMGTLIGWDA